MFTVLLLLVAFFLGSNVGLIAGAICNNRIKKQIDQMKEQAKDDEQCL